MKKYIVYPGYVRSPHDKDTHFVSFQELCHLYGVRAEECVRYTDKSSVLGLDLDKFIHLHVRSNGNYPRVITKPAIIDPSTDASMAAIYTLSFIRSKMGSVQLLSKKEKAAIKKSMLRGFRTFILAPPYLKHRTYVRNAMRRKAREDIAKGTTNAE